MLQLQKSNHFEGIAIISFTIFMLFNLY